MTENHWLDSVLRDLAADTAYPATPDLEFFIERTPIRPSRTRTFAVAVMLIIAIVVVVPPVRSAMVEWIKIGAVTLQRWFSEDALREAPTADSFLAQVATQVSLAEAQLATPYPLALPTRPADLGQPAELWLLANPSGPTVISIWRQADSEARLVLYQILADDLIRKSVKHWQETRVGDQRAIWTSGPHLMRLPSGDWQSWALIEDNVLIWWTKAGVTFRMETREDLHGAIDIAESLQAIPETNP